MAELSSELATEYEARRPLLESLCLDLSAAVADELTGPHIDRISFRVKTTNGFVKKAMATVEGRSKYTDPLREIEDQIAGRNDSWAVRWRASVILNDMLSLYPQHSLACNVGFDGSGTHGSAPDMDDEKPADTPIRVEPIPMIHSDAAFQEFARFNKRFQHYNFKERLVRKLRKIMPSLVN